MTRKLSKDTIREIRERVSIVDVVSPHVSLTPAGKYLKGLCPFHDDKNPSFVVNPERNTCHCFACNKGGDVFFFYMEYHKVSFVDALEELARRAGIRLEPRREKRPRGEEEAHHRAVALNRSVSLFYSEMLLKNPTAEQARRYLAGRGVDSAMIDRFAIGYAPKAWDGLLKRLRRNSASLETAVTLGLVQPRKSGQGHYDRFRNRIMFPITGSSGQIVGFGGRALDDDGPKYMNSPESFLYHKSTNLYGLEQALPSIREKDEAVLVEGYMDLIALHQAGFTNSVAVLGTALTEAQIRLLRRSTANFLLLFDGDDAGRKASFRNLPEFLARRVNARGVYLPQGEDPDSLLRKEGATAFSKRLSEASPLLDTFLAEKVRSISGGDSLSGKVEVLRDILPVLRKIPDPIEQQFRIRAMAEKLGIEETFLREVLSKATREKQEPRQEPAGSPSRDARPRWPREESLVCQILLQYPGLASQLLDAKVIDAFSDVSLRGVAQALSDHFRARGHVDLPEILALQDDPGLAQLLTGLSCREEFTEEEAPTALRDSIHRIRRKNLQVRLKRLNRQIGEAANRNEKDLQNRLFLEKQRLLKEEKAL